MVGRVERVGRCARRERAWMVETTAGMSTLYSVVDQLETENF